MWFKTRTGLSCVEGTLEIWADRWVHPKAGRCAGVFVYQVRQPEFTYQRLFRSAVQITNRKMYLACFPDDDAVERQVQRCMERVEIAIREAQPICDLSDLGTFEAWGTPETTIMWK